MEPRDPHTDAAAILEGHFQAVEAETDDNVGGGLPAGADDAGSADGADQGGSSGDAGADDNDNIGIEQRAAADDTAGADTGSDTVEGGEPDATGSSEPEFELKALAEKLGVDLKDVYAVEIPLGQDNGSMTLGQIKDRFNDVVNVDQAKASLLGERTEQQNEILVARQELQQVIGMMGENLSPELLQHARQQHQVMISREAESIMQVLPQWKNPDTFQADRSRINEFLGKYGFSQAELSSVYDHRLLKLAYDSERMLKRHTKAHETVQQVNQATPRKPGKQINKNRSNAQKKQHILKRAKEGGQRDQLDGVDFLING